MIIPQLKNKMSLLPIDGVYPLSGRCRGSWFGTENSVNSFQDLLQQYGSPLNLHNPEIFQSNINELKNLAATMQLPLDIFFARKANKCLEYLSVCKDTEIGVDVASYHELIQTLAVGIQGSQIICSAAVKSRELMKECLVNFVTIVVDNLEEFREIAQLSKELNIEPCLCLRLSGFKANGKKLKSRFGIDIHQIEKTLQVIRTTFADKSIKLQGLQFHLSGYSAQERFRALDQTLETVSSNQALVESISFIDIGGGLPVNYLAEKSQWLNFWGAIRCQTEEENQWLTYNASRLGLSRTDCDTRGSRCVYPFWQLQAGGEWLEQIFAKEGSSGIPLQKKAEQMGLRFRCEPGRWLLKNCGVTLARVAHVKRMPDGEVYVSLFMNQTQCLTGSMDYMCDPYLVKAEGLTIPVVKRDTGYLFGSYCTETDLIIKRRLAFPAVVKRGDIILLENTAGYFMHFRESESHQIPLAKNIIYKAQTDNLQPEFELDEIDASRV